jgi:hypothetical protein
VFSFVEALDRVMDAVGEWLYGPRTQREKPQWPGVAMLVVSGLTIGTALVLIWDPDTWAVALVLAGLGVFALTLAALCSWLS